MYLLNYEYIVLSGLYHFPPHLTPCGEDHTHKRKVIMHNNSATSNQHA